MLSQSRRPKQWLEQNIISQNEIECNDVLRSGPKTTDNEIIVQFSRMILQVPRLRQPIRDRYPLRKVLTALLGVAGLGSA